MSKDGTRPRAHGASYDDEPPAEDEFFDTGGKTIVDPEAGRRAAALIAAARGFGQHEVPTKESKNVAAALAEHERTLAAQRPVADQPTPAAGFDLGRDALEGAAAPPEQELEDLDDTDEDRFDIPVAPGAAPSPRPPRPRGRGGTLVVIALVAAASGFAAYRYGAPRLLGVRPPPVSWPQQR